MVAGKGLAQPATKASRGGSKHENIFNAVSSMEIAVDSVANLIEKVKALEAAPDRPKLEESSLADVLLQTADRVDDISERLHDLVNQLEVILF